MKKQTHPDANQGGLATTLAAAVDHKDLWLRTRLSGRLDEWVASLKPKFTEADVAGALARQPGTEIEPFVLEGDELKIATVAIRAAFSRKCHQTRFRVVSAETIGTHGGVVLTKSLNGFLVERFAHARLRKTPWHFWFIAPAHRRRGDACIGSFSGRQGRARATCTVTERGWQIVLPESAWSVDSVAESATTRSKTSLAGHLFGTDRSLQSLGLVVGVERGRIVLQPAGPEAMVRLGALAHKRPWVVLENPDDSGGARRRIYVRLEPLDQERLELPLLNALVSPGTEWLSFGAGFWPALPLEDQVSVGHQFPVPDAWVTPAFLEALA